MDEFLAASGLFAEVFGAALDFAYLHVYSCGCFAFVVQYVVALLVWAIVPSLFSARHFRGLYLLGGLCGGLL